MFLTQSADTQPPLFFVANGVLSAISDNVFVATIYINEVKAALDSELITREEFDNLAVAINTGTNIPSVATPNGQAAFLFLLTSSLAPLIDLSYLRMVVMALPYTIVLSIVGFISIVSSAVVMSFATEHKVCIAPMMQYTDMHDRYLLRLISKKVYLYTEMVTTGAILFGKCFHQLEYNPQEHPVAVQLGGSEIKDLVECAKISEDYGYDEINLNVGCPSDRVQKGRFGACLMLEPDHVAECLEINAETMYQFQYQLNAG